MIPLFMRALFVISAARIHQDEVLVGLYDHAVEGEEQPPCGRIENLRLHPFSVSIDNLGRAPRMENKRILEWSFKF
jgi:hypothetical protein